jgi:hypothetical protein
MAVRRMKKPKAIKADGSFDWTPENIYDILRYKETTMMPYEVIFLNLDSKLCKWMADVIDKAKEVDEVRKEVGIE